MTCHSMLGYISMQGLLERISKPLEHCTITDRYRLQSRLGARLGQAARQGRCRHLALAGLARCSNTWRGTCMSVQGRQYMVAASQCYTFYFISALFHRARQTQNSHRHAAGRGSCQPDLGGLDRWHCSGLGRCHCRCRALPYKSKSLGNVPRIALQVAICPHRRTRDRQ